MSNTTPLSPASLFSRIETLKKWQTEQQQRLLQQQSQQSKFLLNEHKRLNDALSVREESNENTSNDIEESNSYINNHDNSSNHHDQVDYSEEETEDNACYSEDINHSNVDEMPIKSPIKDFNALLEEKLRENVSPVLNQYGKPKQKFLKKGAGLSRFRMTINDLAHKKPKPKLPINKKRQELSQVQHNEPRIKEVPKVNRETRTKENVHAESKINFRETNNARRNFGVQSTSNDTTKYKSSVFNKIEPLNLCPDKLVLNKKHSDIVLLESPKTSKIKFTEPKAVWTPVQEENPTDYRALLAELIEVRQSNPALFDTPMINKSAENDQQMFEKELLDELKLFEALEQKTLNNSFSSTSSLITKFLDHPIKSTPRKQIDFNFLTIGIPEEESVIEVKKISTSPKRKVSFSDQLGQKQHEEETDTFTSNDESDSDTSQDSNSSVNSDDVCNIKTIVPTKFQNEKTKNTVIFKDVATNTDQPVINSELLKTRLEELEKELETFRSENAKVNKLKTQLETDHRNFEKRKRQLEKEIEEQKMKVKTQLDEERAKLAKDRSVYDRYVREMREGKSARMKDKEELSALRSKLTSLEEEMKLKDSKWGATQARIRSQLKHLEKENATLRTENNELRTKNGKLEATNKQLLSRRPTDTKVLHEINKNLTKIAQESKEKAEPNIKQKKSENVTRKSIDTNKSENTRTRTRSRSKNRNSPPPRTHENENKENRRYSLNSTDESKSSTDRSFESVEREYEKLFGKSSHEHEEHANLPAAEASACTDLSGKREEIVLEDGSIRITYPNGNVRTISSDGQMIVMQYHNGDLKETCKETGVVKYLFSDAKTWHTTFPDGMELLEFPNGQIEKRFLDGSSEIHFPNGSRRCTSPGGTEEVSFSDGTLLLTKSASGERILTLPNGQREIHTRDHKRREYPDGTIKLLYPDGVQETRYANGRIRLKDKQGNLIMDSATV